MLQNFIPGVSSSPMKFASQAKGIIPSCSICGEPLVKVMSGLVCLTGHGPIIPLQEFCEQSPLLVNHAACETIKQIAMRTAAAQIERAQRALERLNQAPRKEGQQ